MSSLYPSLEDMQVHKMVLAQDSAVQQMAYPALNESNDSASTAYPALANFMGLELSQEVIALNMPEYMQNGQLNAVMRSGMIAPLSGQSAGLKRAEVNHGIREVIACKGADDKVGLRVQDVMRGVFITLVCKDSPAAMVGYAKFLFLKFCIICVAFY